MDALTQYRLEELQQTTGRSLKQENGERILGPPSNWHGPPPERGSEVFIGKIPRNVFEDLLLPVLETVGIVYMLRLKMDFSGHNRGFAFVLYSSPEVAQAAVNILNGVMIQPGHRLGVSMSVDNRQLVIYGLPTEAKAADVASVLNPHVSGLNRVTAYRMATVTEAVIEFVSHNAAAKARRVLVPHCVILWNQSVSVDWADPRRYPSD